MKSLLLLLFIFSTNVFAFEREHVNQLLSKRDLSLQQLERQGHELLLGEVTGAGRIINLNQVQIILLQDRIVLKKEIESISTINHKSGLKDLESFRAFGLYFTREDIKGVISKK